MTDDELSPYEATRLRVVYRTRRQFAREANALDSEPPHSWSDVREALLTLSRSERRALQTRERHALQSLDDLCEGDHKQFDAPRATLDDTDVTFDRAGSPL